MFVQNHYQVTEEQELQLKAFFKFLYIFSDIKVFESKCTKMKTSIYILYAMLCYNNHINLVKRNKLPIKV